ncbi:hypothetical protein G9A89_019602 [Geosiphon pyriformis]|nr:hypothetical protein G9A89_019602 [Geosiphon pyriformis]
MVVHQLIPSLSNQQIGSRQWNSEDATSNNLKSDQQTTLINNILPTTVTNDRLLTAIFPFELEKPSQLLLFSGAALKEKPITVMYTNVKVDRHPIKLILNSGLADSIITKQFIDQLDGTMRMPIGEIDDFPIEVNGIITPIKLSRNEQHTQVPAMCGHFKTTNSLAPLIDFKEKTKPIWKAYQEELSNWEWKEEKEKGKKREEENTQANNTYIPYTYSQQQSSTYCQPKLICIDCSKKLLSMGACCGNNEEYQTATKFYCCACLVEHFGKPKQNNIPGRRGMCDVSCQYTILINDWIKKGTPIEAVWRRAIQMAIAKIERNAEPVINFLEPEEFHEHYQNLASIREEQEQWLAQLNTRLCCHCLIPSDFEYCDDCDLIYNSPLCMIYMIPKEEEPISSCALESESLLDPNSNPDNNDDKNNSSSSIQNGNNNDNNINPDSNSDSNYEQYIVLSDLTKEQELK